LCAHLVLASTKRENRRGTQSERKKRKRGGADNLAKTAEKLLAAQLRAAAVEEAQKCVVVP
jgi:DNA excision repair protein ERCC-5